MDFGQAERPTSGASEAELVAQLREVRRRTRWVTEDLSSAELMGPYREIVNPVLWELGHIAWFHEHWTLRTAAGRAPLISRGDRLWDSSNVAHKTRWHLDLPDRAGTYGYMADVLAHQEELLGSPVDEATRYTYDLSIRHEDMHVEALSYMRQTSSNAPVQGVPSASSVQAGALAGDAAVPGGSWRLGSTPSEGFIFDNEKWAHATTLAPFRIARAAVTNAQFAAFVEAGGYAVREFWSDAGWAWRESRNATRPVYWQEKRDGVWTWRRYRQEEPLRPHAAVVFVNWFEADAWCRWAKRRLPTEAEWEAAAIGEPAAGGAELSRHRRLWPWGEAMPDATRANLDFAFGDTIDVGALPDSDSAFGCRQMIGNSWEWTSTPFEPFEGFSPDLYADYSRPWFGTRKVLRGGAWATSARIARPAYRNFFTPDRSDIFAGFRTCAL
jgi:iron(II)-dependent oxidoreductase